MSVQTAAFQLDMTL